MVLQLKGCKNSFQIKKESKVIQNRLVRNIRNLFEHEEEGYYCKPVRVNNFWSTSCIEYESNGVKFKALSVQKYLNKIRSYLKDIINNLKKYDTRKI